MHAARLGEVFSARDDRAVRHHHSLGHRVRMSRILGLDTTVASNFDNGAKSRIARCRKRDFTVIRFRNCREDGYGRNEHGKQGLYPWGELES